MSRVPDDIPGLGKAGDRLRQNPDFDASGYAFDRDSYFVWSRLDGYTSTRDVILMVGFAVEHTLGILARLRGAGALLRPGESAGDVAHLLARPAPAADPAARPARAPTADPAARPARAATADPAARPARAPTADPAARPARARTADPAPPRRAVTASPAPGPAMAPSSLSAEEAAALAADVELSAELRQRIIAMRRTARDGDYFALLGVSADTDRRELKRAYFRLSKEFHPDRYYRKNTGPFGPWLAQIFETVTQAFDVLSDETDRARYVASITGEHKAVAGQTREAYARDLFERACNAEAAGDSARALTMFAAAIRVDAQARYLGRAARCATAAKELAVAEEYAKKAADLEPKSPSVARILADVYRAADKLADAESTLVRALELKSENDVLARELAADLAAVRAARARPRRGGRPRE